MIESFMKTALCPHCGAQDGIRLDRQKVLFNSFGEHFTVDAECYRCRSCNNTFMNGKQIDAMMEKSIGIKKKIEAKQKIVCPLRGNEKCLALDSACAIVNTVTCEALRRAYSIGKNTKGDV